MTKVGLGDGKVRSLQTSATAKLLKRHLFNSFAVAEVAMSVPKNDIK